MLLKHTTIKDIIGQHAKKRTRVKLENQYSGIMKVKDVTELDQYHKVEHKYSLIIVEIK